MESELIQLNGISVPFAHLTNAFHAIETITARLKILDLLMNMFRYGISFPLQRRFHLLMA